MPAVRADDEQVRDAICGFGEDLLDHGAVADCSIGDRGRREPVEMEGRHARANPVGSASSPASSTWMAVR
jgi:hypothetical protein